MTLCGGCGEMKLLVHLAIAKQTMIGQGWVEVSRCLRRVFLGGRARCLPASRPASERWPNYVVDAKNKRVRVKFGKKLTFADIQKCANLLPSDSLFASWVAIWLAAGPRLAGRTPYG
jgi:hypothetical protein